MFSNNRRNFLKLSALVGAGMGIVPAIDAFSFSNAPTAGKRIGIIGLDTSHSEVFTKMINNGGVEMSGYKVVAAYPHGSRDIASAINMKPKITEAVKAQGVEIVDSIEALLGKVDVVLLESNDGRPHLEQALPVFKAGKRIFIDKPIAPSLGEAHEIFKVASQYNTPLFTSSALRFDLNVQKVVAGSIGKVTGADVYTPAEIDKNHADLAWYAIHGVEMLFTVMGPGCKEISRVHRDGTDLVTGVWEDGRIGTVRGIRKGASSIAGTAFGEKGIAALGPFSGYEPLVGEIISFFQTGKVPVSREQTLEIFSFIDAADKSKRKGGKPVSM
ncbi:Gfo/Idh/MocA family oxidoreductase [Dyadobacter sp. LHD-138]|uniref:Gfo/Idh/MocA family protein n=1 Tax=Dyadobacter sp. LHD-138 TaxID=3071413 RepID=UPI0027E07937|nr:Gfo/Idh/MocA family oxidoreductase [Dyadobacter sp. LHD-138]MDQ6477378.1 Gfo/Idh/MocA family oxidoreductase [Dyadobacter sp. LHD-138]